MAGFDCAVRARMGLPWSADRDQSRQGTGRQEVADGAYGRARLECRKYAQKFLDLQREQFKRIGVFGRFDWPYATMTPQYESVVLSTFFSLLRKRISSTRACARFTGACTTRLRWRKRRSSTKTTTSPTVWVKYALVDDPATIDPALAGQESLYDHLDDDSMDAASFHGGGVSSGRGVRGARIWRRGLHCRGQAGLGGRSKKWHHAQRRLARFPGRKLNTSELPAIRFSIARFSAFWPTTSPWTRARASSTLRPPMVRRISLPASVQTRSHLQRRRKRNHAQRPAGIRRQACV